MALLKLSAAGGDAGGSLSWILPRVDVSSPTLEALFGAVERRKRVRFSYRTGGGGPAAERTIDPYSIRYKGAWYVTGFDHDRGDVRLFKVDRIDGKVGVGTGKKPDFEPPPAPVDAFPSGPWEGELGTVRIAFAPDVAWWAERRTGAKRTAERSDGWVELEMGLGDLERFVGWVLGFGDDAEVISPAELRDAVVARLRAAATQGA